MMNNISKMVVLFTMFGCASLQPSPTIVPQHDLKIMTVAGDQVDLKKDQPYQLKKTPIYAHANGKVSAVIVDSYDSNEIKLNLNDINEWNKEIVQEKASELASVSMKLMLESQRLIKSKQYETAITKLTKHTEEYPKMHYIYFIKASAELLAGRKDACIESLNVALKSFPDDQAGRALYEKVTGKPYKVE